MALLAQKSFTVRKQINGKDSGVKGYCLKVAASLKVLQGTEDGYYIANGNGAGVAGCWWALRKGSEWTYGQALGGDMWYSEEDGRIYSCEADGAASWTDCGAWRTSVLKGKALKKVASLKVLSATAEGVYLADGNGAGVAGMWTAELKGGKWTYAQAQTGDTWYVEEDGHQWTALSGKTAWTDCGLYKGDKGDTGDTGKRTYTYFRYSDDGGKSFTAATPWVEPLTVAVELPEATGWEQKDFDTSPGAAQDYTACQKESTTSLMVTEPVQMGCDWGYSVAEGYKLDAYYLDWEKKYQEEQNTGLTGSGRVDYDLEKGTWRYMMLVLRKADGSEVGDDAAAWLAAAQLSITQPDYGHGRNLMLGTWDGWKDYPGNIRGEKWLNIMNEVSYWGSLKLKCPKGSGNTNMTILSHEADYDLVPGDGKKGGIWWQGSGNIGIWSTGYTPTKRLMPLTDKETVFSGKCSATYWLKPLLYQNSRWTMMTRADYLTGKYLRVKGLKAELGGVATEWTPAPEDQLFGLTAGKWLGVAVSEKPYPPMDVSDYTWSKIAGEDGKDGSDGLTGLAVNMVFKGTYAVGGTSTLTFNYFNRTPVVGDMFMTVDGGGNFGVWQVTAVSGTTATIKCISLKNIVGPKGPQGSQGPQGPTGPQGPQGEKGSDATVAATYSLVPTEERASMKMVGYGKDATTGKPDGTYVWSLAGKLEYDSIMKHDAAGDTPLEWGNYIGLGFYWEYEVELLAKDGSEIWRAAVKPLTATGNADYGAKLDIVPTDEEKTAGAYPVAVRVTLRDKDKTALDTRIVAVKYDSGALLDTNSEQGYIIAQVWGDAETMDTQKGTLASSVATLTQTSASLTTRMGKAEAQIGTSVQYDKATGEITSDVKLKADKIKLEGAVSANKDFQIDEWGNLVLGVDADSADVSKSTADVIVESKSNLVFGGEAFVYLPNDPEFIGRRITIISAPESDNTGQIKGVFVDEDTKAEDAIKTLGAVTIQTGRVFVKRLYGDTESDGGVGIKLIRDSNDRDAYTENGTLRKNARALHKAFEGVGYFAGKNTVVVDDVFLSYPSTLTLISGYVELIGIPYSVSRMYGIEKCYAKDANGVMTEYSVFMNRYEKITDAAGNVTQYPTIIDDTDGNKLHNGLIKGEAKSGATATTDADWQKTPITEMCRWIVVNSEAAVFNAE